MANKFEFKVRGLSKAQLPGLNTLLPMEVSKDKHLNISSTEDPTTGHVTVVVECLNDPDYALAYIDDMAVKLKLIYPKTLFQKLTRGGVTVEPPKKLE